MIQRRGPDGRAQPLAEPSSKRAWHHRARAFLKDRCEGEGRRHHPELHAHHADGDYRNCVRENILTLCRWCHLRAHGKATPRQAGWVMAKGRA